MLSRYRGHIYKISLCSLGFLFALKFTMSHCPFPFLERNFLNVAYLKPAMKTEQSASCAVWTELHSQTWLVSVLAINDDNPSLKFTKFSTLRKLLSLKFILAFIPSE